VGSQVMLFPSSQKVVLGQDGGDCEEKEREDTIIHRWVV
jgi:hypothetical protein